MQSIHSFRTSIDLPDQLSSCLPVSLCDAVEKCGAKSIEEIRLHRGRVATVTYGGKNYYTNYILKERDINEILHRMCGGSLYAFEDEINNGYLTLDGGIRVGVCGSAAAENKTQLVPDVHQFPGHIACDSASNSEIVIPLHKEGCVFGVLDIDSPRLDRFSQADRVGLEEFARILESNI